MAVLSPNQIAGYAIQAGFSGNDVATAVAVALAESGGNTDITSPPNTNGTTDYGLFQINSIHNPTAQKWQDPAINTAMAKKIFDDRAKAQGIGWKAWSTYNSGKYLAFLAQGRAGASKPETPNGQGTTVPSGGAPTTSDLGGISGLMTLLSDPKTWLKVGYFVGGVVLLLIGLYKVFQNSKTGQAVQGFAMDAVKVATLGKV